MSRTIGQRLLRMNALVVSVALLLTCGAFLVYERVTFRGTMVARLNTQAEIIAHNAESALLFNDAPAATDTLAALAAERDIIAVDIVRDGDQPFASYQRTGGPPVDRRAAPVEGHRFLRDRLVLSRPILSQGAPIGRLVIHADLDEMTTRLTRYVAIGVGVAFFSMLTGLLLASRLQRRISRPILELATAARNVTEAKNYAVRVAVSGPDELGMLGATFNEMLAQIEARDRELSRARDELEQRVADRTRELSEQNEQVQQATRMKSEFLANMSHELRTPLNAIIGFTQLLHAGQVSPDSPEHHEFLGDVLGASRHLLKLINDVLDLSKVEAGKMEFYPETVELRGLVDDVVATLRSLAAEKRQRVETELDPSVATVFLDRSKLKQVLLNYLSNAIKFTGEGGRIVIRVVPAGAEHFRIDVEDSGIGIPEDQLGRLFEEFHQLDAGAAKKYAGTGLGLALTRRILQAQGGRHGARSVPGKGSTFFAVLPRRAAGAVAEEPPEPASDQPVVLVVEDESVDQARIASALAGSGYAMELARTGAQAIAKVKAKVYDRITLDILLPDVSGWEVLRTIRHDSLNQSTPVIVTTTLPEEQIGSVFAIQDFLVKPLRAEELIPSLSRATASDGDAQEVLVVDDDPQALQLMEASLAAIGYGSICERSGAAGLLAVSARRPAAIIVDLMMPKMDGFEFLAKLREMPEAAAIPVIVWTMKDLTFEDRARLRKMAQAAVPKGGDTVRQLVEELGKLVPGGDREKRKA